MVKVTLQNVFSSARRGEAWLLLADESGKRGLPIFVGSGDGTLIALSLRKDNPRPLTYNFFASILDATGVELVEVRVTELVGITFRALAFLRAGGIEHRVDARPSDAVALAAVMNWPIHVSDELMATCGQPLGAEGRPPEIPESFVSLRHLWAAE
jgi:uncharacterized protein